MSAQSAATLRKQPAAPPPTKRILSWGRYPKTAPHRAHKPAWNDQVPDILRAAAPNSLLPYGLGRSYGDSCLNAGRELIDCRRLNRILGFDESTRMLRSESGVSLSDVIDVFLPKGWFLPVTPGTRFITVGGAIAWADIQLKRVAGPWIDAESIPFQSLSGFIDLSRESNDRFEYTVAWLDCFAGKHPRGIFFRANHSAERGKQFNPKRGPKLPFALPAWMLNRYSVGAFNTAYYKIHATRKSAAVVPYDSFFYPLDSIRQWNLLYGKQGFLQYQCVIPETNTGAVEELLDRIARSGMGSFLGVLKQFGSTPPAGILSFPRPGITIALDFAMRGERTLELMQSLDEVVEQSGGAIYPAKDARMSSAVFEASFPRWRAFVPYIDPKMSSSFWRRVTGAQ